MSDEQNVVCMSMAIAVEDLFGMADIVTIFSSLMA